jgi:hypothetical protein
MLPVGKRLRHSRAHRRTKKIEKGPNLRRHEMPGGVIDVKRKDLVRPIGEEVDQHRSSGRRLCDAWVNRPHAVRAEGACRERSLNVFYSDDRRQRLGDEPVYRERSDPD